MKVLSGVLAGYPIGSYLATCDFLFYSEGVMHAVCQDHSGKYKHTQLRLTDTDYEHDIVNCDGVLAISDCNVGTLG